MGSDLKDRQADTTRVDCLTLPLNISQSIFQTLINILTNSEIVPVQKDFLIDQIVNCLSKLLENQKL